MKVMDAMTHSVAACDQDDTLNRAAQLMWEGDCGCIPVLGASGDVRGIITDRDICMAAYTQGLPLQQIPVRRAMSTVVQTCGPEDSIESALALMRRNKVRRVPVTDGVRPVGMLSISDVMRVLRSSHGKHPEGPHAAVIETLWIISEPSDTGQATEGKRGSRGAPPHADSRRN
jgi:CBS domain-containing protein